MRNLKHLAAKNRPWKIAVWASITKHVIEQTSFRGPEKLFDAVLPIGRLFLFGPCTTRQLDLPIQANLVWGKTEGSENARHQWQRLRKAARLVGLWLWELWMEVGSGSSNLLSARAVVALHLFFRSSSLPPWQQPCCIAAFGGESGGAELEDGKAGFLAPRLAVGGCG